jgi:hypothetical protein
VPARALKPSKPPEWHAKQQAKARSASTTFNLASVPVLAPKPEKAAPVAGRCTPRTAPQPKPEQLRTDDPATMVELARRGPPTVLPHREAASRWFGVTLHGLEVHRDANAALACARLKANAFAVAHIVVFAEEAPSLPLVLHEVAHVLQQDALGRAPVNCFAPGSLSIADPASPLEREASSAHLPGVRSKLSRAPLALYREQPEAKVEPNTPTAEAPLNVSIPEDVSDNAAKRLWLFAAYSEFALSSLPRPRFGVRKVTASDISFEPFTASSPRPFKRENYVKFITSPRGKVLLDATKLNAVADTTAGGDFNNIDARLKRLGASRVRRYENEGELLPYAFTRPLSQSPPTEAPLAFVTDLFNAEARLSEFKKGKGNDVFAPSEKGKDLYGIPGVGEGQWTRKFPLGSEKSFSAETYKAWFPPKPVAPNGEDTKSAEDVNDPEGDLPKVLSLDSRKIFGLVRVGSENATTYAFVAGALYPDDGVVRFTTKVEKVKKSPSELIEGYRGIIIKIPRLNGQTLPDRDPKNKNPDVDDKDPTKNRPDKNDVKYARYTLMDWVLEKYGENDGVAFFKDIIGGGGVDPFGRTYARIKGNLFEKWIFKYRYKNNPSLKIDEKQPFFRWEEVTAESARFQKTRMGDGVLISTKGAEAINIILEAKAYTASKVPTVGNEKTDVKEATKDDDLVLQMKDYRTIITRPVKASYLTPSSDSGDDDDSDAEFEDDSKQKATPLTPADVIFKYVVYEFGDVTVAQAWQTALQKTLLNYYTTDPQLPGDKAAETVALTIGINPTIPIQLTGASNKTDFQVTQFSKQTPGVKLREANIKLSLPGRPLLAKGSSLLMDIDMGGIKQEGIEKPIEPTTLAPGEKPKPGQKPVDGRAENKFTNLRSSLDQFLKRVTYDAHLIDRGVEAKVGLSDGPSGIPGIDIIGTEISATYKQGSGLGIKGDIGLQRSDGKIRGKVSVKYEKEDWTFAGEVTVANLIQGLDPFTAKVFVHGEERRIGADSVKITRTIGGVKVTGSLTNVSYDLGKKSFSSGVHLDADLKLFGKVSADGNVENDELTKLEFRYDKEFTYPGGKSPMLRGNVVGVLAYEKGKFSGGLGGTAYLKLPALEKIDKSLGDLGFVIDAHVGSEGQFSGSIGLAENKPIAVGSYLRVPALELALHEDGTLSSSFALEVVPEKLKYVKEARISCEITREGKFRVAAANVKVKIGDETKDRVAAQLGLEYQQKTEAFIITGKVWIRIKEGIVAIGTLTYDTVTGLVNASLSVNPITLLDWHGKKTFLNIKKQVELISFYKIIGVYLDVRFELTFKYGFDLKVATAIELQALNIETFEFALAIARVKLTGALEAILEATPGVGLGLFVISTSLLRGGGGVKVPVAGRAVVTPSGVVEIRYRPDGTIEGGSRVGLTLSFGIKASIKPYAELSVLDGAWEPSWEGDALAEFPIMEERELFTYYLDFGAGLEKQEGEPELPSGEHGKAPPKKDSNEKARFGTALSGDKSEDPPKGLRDRELPEKADQEPEKGKKSGGFDFMEMVTKLLNSPKFAPIKKVLQAASDTWDAISGFIGKIISFFKNWFDIVKEGIDAFVEAIRFIAEHGVIAFFKRLPKRVLGPVYDIIAPLFDALEKIAGKFEDRLDKLLSTPIPLEPWAFLKWIIDVLGDVLSIGVSSLADLAIAVKDVIANALDAGGKFINYLVEQGKIGVRRHVYYIPGIRHNTYFYAPTEYKIDIWGFKREEKVDGDLVGWRDVVSPSRVVHKAIAFVLWEVLDHIPQVKSTHVYTADADDSDVDDDTRRNYWV